MSGWFGGLLGGKGIDWDVAGPGLTALGAGLVQAGAGGPIGNTNRADGLAAGILGMGNAMRNARQDRRRQQQEDEANAANGRFYEAFAPDKMGPDGQPMARAPEAMALRQAVPESMRSLLATIGPQQGMQALPGLLQQAEADRAFQGLLSGRGGAPVAMPQAAVPAPAAPGPRAAATPPAELMPFFQQASQETGVPVPILLAQAQQESGFRPDAVGAAGEVGIAQVHPRTMRDPGFGVPPITPEQARDPAQAIQWQARYLAARARAANGGQVDWNNPQHVDAGLRAYNGGGDPNYIANVRRFMPNGAPVQTAAAPAGPATEAVPGSGPAMPPGAATPVQNALPASIPGRGGIPAPGAAELARAQELRQEALRFAMSRDPRAQAMARSLDSQATALEARAEAERARQDNPPPTVVLGEGPHGPAGVYQRERGGGLTRIGAVPPPTTQVNVDQRGQNAFDTERGKTLATEEASIRAGTTAAGNTLMRLGTIEQALDRFTTGTTSGARITVGQMAQQLGVPDSVLSSLGLSRDQVAQGENIRSVASQLLQGLLGPGGFPSANFSNADREMLERALPSLANSPGGNRVIIGIMRAQAERTRDIGRAWNEWRRTNGSGMESFDRFQQERLPAITDTDVLAPLLQDYARPVSDGAPGPARPGVQADPPPPAGAPPAAPSRPRAANAQGQVLEFDGQAWVPVR